MVVGSGAREHALAWALASRAQVVVTPGNDGMRAHGLTCVDTAAGDLDADLFVIGPEQPLVEGLADDLRDQGKVVVGPGRAGAQLEGSKAYMKEFLTAAGVPSADFATFDAPEAAVAFLRTLRAPYVVKTDGLAAGKGVLVTQDFDEACADVRAKLSGRAFGAAGERIIVEEGLDGAECSLLVLCDGQVALPLAAAQDFKRVGDDDLGANTGGMGAYAPMELGDDQVTTIMRDIVAPTLVELARRSIDFRGVLYAGVMLSARGPQLLEYNVRFGDPEAEVLAALYGGELLDLLVRVGEGRLAGAAAPVRGAAVTVVLASAGYPASARTGDPIDGLGADGQLREAHPGVVVFHAGTVRDAQGRFYTAGGRVLCVTATGSSLEQARTRAYEAASLVTFEGRVMRRDIARDAL